MGIGGEWIIHHNMLRHCLWDSKRACHWAYSPVGYNVLLFYPLTPPHCKVAMSSWPWNLTMMSKYNWISLYWKRQGVLKCVIVRLMGEGVRLNWAQDLQVTDLYRYKLSYVIVGASEPLHPCWSTCHIPFLRQYLPGGQSYYLWIHCSSSNAMGLCQGRGPSV